MSPVGHRCGLVQRQIASWLSEAETELIWLLLYILARPCVGLPKSADEIDERNKA